LFIALPTEIISFCSPSPVKLFSTTNALKDENKLACYAVNSQTPPREPDASMHKLRPVFFLILFLATLGAPCAARAEISLDAKTAPYGLYKIDPDHTSVTFKINHLGFSHYTGRFNKIEGILNFNNNALEQSSLDIIVYPTSIDTNNPKLEEDLRTDKWFNVIKFPRATFHATHIDRTGAMTGKIIGDFTLLGITRRMTLDTTFVGTGSNFFSKKQVLGFSAVATFDRSDFGMSNLLPMLGNEVVLEIEAEFNKAE
jgi:polyisoprenoid-binding protein YceI